MIYGYARVSSKGQESYGTSLESQELELMKEGAAKVYKEAYTGTKFHRPELDKLLETIESGDTVIVMKLDRIARSTEEGIKIIDKIVDKGCRLIIKNMGTFENNAMGRMMRTIMLGFAEFERDMIVERTTQGKARKKASDPNYKEGRKYLKVPGFNEYKFMVQNGIMSVSEACKKLGISRSKWYSLVKEFKI